MTTCVVYNGMLAADTQTTAGDIKFFEPKIERIGKIIIAAAGKVSDIEKFKQWLVDAEEIELDETFQAIIIKDGKAYDAFHDLTLLPIYEISAAGSGSQAAMGAYNALKAKKISFTAADLVKAACDTDIYSGGKIQKVKF